jgi:hypothetical protein
MNVLQRANNTNSDKIIIVIAIVVFILLLGIVGYTSPKNDQISNIPNTEPEISKQDKCSQSHKLEIVSQSKDDVYDLLYSKYSISEYDFEQLSDQKDFQKYSDLVSAQLSKYPPKVLCDIDKVNLVKNLKLYDSEAGGLHNWTSGIMVINTQDLDDRYNENTIKLTTASIVSKNLYTKYYLDYFDKQKWESYNPKDFEYDSNLCDKGCYKQLTPELYPTGFIEKNGETEIMADFGSFASWSTGLDSDQFITDIGRLHEKDPERYAAIFGKLAMTKEFFAKLDIDITTLKEDQTRYQKSVDYPNFKVEIEIK